jgi:hypothetical protein
MLGESCWHHASVRHAHEESTRVHVGVLVQFSKAHAGMLAGNILALHAQLIQRTFSCMFAIRARVFVCVLVVPAHAGLAACARADISMRITHAHSLMLMYLACLYGAVCALAWGHWSACVTTDDRCRCVFTIAPACVCTCACPCAAFALYLKQCIYVQIMDDHLATCISKTAGATVHAPGSRIQAQHQAGIHTLAIRCQHTQP